MKAIGILVVLAVASGSAIAASQSDVIEHFEWPTVQANAIPDLRLSSTISDARSEAREAESRARDAQRATGQAHRREKLKGSVGLGAKPVTIDSGTTMTADEFPPGNHNYLLGTIKYPGGTVMEGAFGPDVGTFTPTEEFPLERFRGWVYGARTSTPIPMVGIFNFRGGDSFSGSYNTGGNASGIYSSTDSSMRFVGEIDFRGATWIPLRGVLENKDGRVLAVVGVD
jgi:hypothetical protein